MKLELAQDENRDNGSNMSVDRCCGSRHGSDRRNSSRLHHGSHRKRLYAPHAGRLHPSHEVVVGKDKCLVYDIPKDKLQEALDKANPLKGHVFFPVGGRKRIPLSNSDKPAPYSKAIIIYYKRYNYIVSPTFFQDGTTSWGWGKRIRVKAKDK